MAKKLIAVGTNDSNPKNWRWIEVALYIADSKEEACRMSHPHLKGRELAMFANEQSCEVDMSESCYVTTKGPPVED